MSTQSSLRGIVAQVERREPEGLAELYEMIRTHVRCCVGQRLGWTDSVDDVTHDVFVTATECIRHGAVKEPDKLLSFAYAIARHLTSREIRQKARRRGTKEAERVPETSTTPEQLHLKAERRQLARSVLNRLPRLEREILERFYLQEQTAEDISREMGLTETQFRLAKSRAKAHFGVLGRKTVARRGMDIVRGPL